MTTAAKPPATALTMTSTVTIRKMTAGFMKHDAFLPRIAGMVVGSLLPRRTHSLYFLTRLLCFSIFGPHVIPLEPSHLDG